MRRALLSVLVVISILATGAPRLMLAASGEQIQLNAEGPDFVGYDLWWFFGVSVTGGPPLGALTVSATSDNQEVLPDSNLQAEWVDGKVRLKVGHTPGVGTATVTITVSDGSRTGSHSFFVTSAPPSDASDRLQPGPWVIPTGETSKIRHFTIGHTAPRENITVKASSADPHLKVSVSRDQYGHFYLDVTPEPGWLGETELLVETTDGSTTTHKSIPVRVKAPGSIEPIPAIHMPEDEPISFPIRISHPDTPIEQLKVRTESMGEFSVAVTGDGPERIVTITPAPDWSGTGTLRLSVFDGFVSASREVEVHVHPINDPPVLSDLPDQVIREDTRSLTVPFTILDDENAFNQLRVQLDQSLFASFGAGRRGTGWEITLVPLRNAHGSTTVTVLVKDDPHVAATSFDLSITPVNDPPSFQAGPNLTVSYDAGSQVIPRWAQIITPGPREDGQTVRFHVTTDALDLFTEVPAIAADGTLRFTPAPGRTGQATVTVLLQDDGGTADGGIDSASERFHITLIEPVKYDDLPPGHWAYETVHFLAARGIVAGTTKTQFAPDAAVTRAVLADMLVRAFGLEEDRSVGLEFTDVAAGSPLAGSIGGVAKAGFMRGDAGGTFRPDGQVTRQELAMVLSRLLRRYGPPDKSPSQTVPFWALLDQSAIAPWAINGVQSVLEAGIMTGRPGPSFAPNEVTTRAEAATVVRRMMEPSGGGPSAVFLSMPKGPANQIAGPSV